MPEVSFISSQRVESGTGFSIGENSYSKWNIQDGATLWVGDIVATGITLQTSINQAIAEYERQSKRCRQVIIITIGTANVINAARSIAANLKSTWGDVFENIEIIFLEGMFTLFTGEPQLKSTHLAYTDLIRRRAPRSVELELETFKQASTLFERCAIYDGGSRSFEPRLYLRNLQRYWSSLLELGGEMSTPTFMRLISDLDIYQLSFPQWIQAVPWWSCSMPSAQLKELYNLGRSVFDAVTNTSLTTICEQRLAQLEGAASAVTLASQ